MYSEEIRFKNNLDLLTETCVYAKGVPVIPVHRSYFLVEKTAFSCFTRKLTRSNDFNLSYSEFRKELARMIGNVFRSLYNKNVVVYVLGFSYTLYDDRRYDLIIRYCPVEWINQELGQVIK